MPFPKSVFISGANRGIGFQLISRILAKWEPDFVFGTFRNVAQAKELHELAKTGKGKGKVHLLQLDMREDDKFEGIAAQVDKITGGSGLNLLINNAGISSRYARLGQVKKENLLENFEVNTVGPILLAKAFVPLLEKASTNYSSPSDDKSLGIHRSAIINISSILGSMSLNDNGALYPYRCSKAALNAATKSMSIDLQKQKILVMSLHPGWVQTDMGGAKAPLTLEQSVSGIIPFLESIGDKNNGGFYDYRGEKLDW